MLCSISGVPPTEPVVSTKTGHVFEKTLIEKHLQVTGTCPVTKEELSPQDLLPLKGNTMIKPRPPTASSIPGMISILQNEWDSLMLETYTMKQHVDTVRQELAHALYQHDAACRVIARLIRERDEARAALSNTQANVGAAIGKAKEDVSDMETDAGISGDVIKKMQTTAKTLSKSRKKRVKQLANEVVKRDILKDYTMTSTHPLHSASKPGITCLDIHEKNQDTVLTGGQDGNAVVFNRKTGKVVDTLKAHKKRVTSVRFHPDEKLIFTTSADNSSIIWKEEEGGKYGVGYKLTNHTDEVIGCTLHPSGSYLVTGSKDKTWSFIDIATGVVRQQVADSEINSGYTQVAFHPDGLILGAGSEDSVVRIFDVKQQKNVANFKGHTGKVTALTFSENGYYLGTGDENGTVKMWDLRKLQNFHTQSSGTSMVGDIQFDMSGSFMAVAASDLKIYNTKGWDLVQTWADHSKDVTSVKFGNNGDFFATTSKDRSLKFYTTS